jgi:uncharacterized membrane protein YphA (DoxX/SURF4 family)
MTSLPSLLVIFAVIGLVFTVLTYRAGAVKSIFYTFLQHFCGVWFIFSGLVKAVDPIGTAYKMQDYFVAFEQTFAGLNNVFKGFAPMFTWLSGYTNGFAITMIVLEIVLGVMLIVGFNRKLTAWLFFIVMVFFTVLTGFTYLTGYVDLENNFFDFAKWGPYVKAQMRVQDCGCFGDFIKLDPKISFLKDIGLMLPAFLFLFGQKHMHQLWTASRRTLVTALGVAATTLFCFYNTYWNLPVVDFRPFKIGNNVRERVALEKSAKTEIIGWVLENTNNGQVVTFMEPEPGKITYYKTYAKADGWKVKDQIQTDLFVEQDGKRVPITRTKVSDFKVEDSQNNEVGETILEEKGYSLMIVAYHLEGEKTVEQITVQDSIYAFDTLKVKDQIQVARRATGVQSRTVEQPGFNAELHYADMFKQLNPVAAAAKQAGWKVYGITTIADAESAAPFTKATGADYPFYRADEKLLKTIIRANPGLVIWKDGAVVGMYHHRHLPSAEALLGRYK